MDLFSLLLILVVVGVLLPMITTIDPNVSKIINILIVVFVIVFLWHYLTGGYGHPLLGRNCGP
jgi:hypothetical protein